VKGETSLREIHSFHASGLEFRTFQNSISISTAVETFARGACRTTLLCKKKVYT